MSSLLLLNIVINLLGNFFPVLCNDSSSSSESESFEVTTIQYHTSSHSIRSTRQHEMPTKFSTIISTPLLTTTLAYMSTRIPHSKRVHRSTTTNLPPLTTTIIITTTTTYQPIIESTELPITSTSLQTTGLPNSSPRMTLSRRVHRSTTTNLPPLTTTIIITTTTTYQPIIESTELPITSTSLQTTGLPNFSPRMTLSRRVHRSTTTSG